MWVCVFLLLHKIQKNKIWMGWRNQYGNNLKTQKLKNDDHTIPSSSKISKYTVYSKLRADSSQGTKEKEMITG